ncbi:Recyclin-1 [Rhodotorula toruloides]|uniref:BY PROTMAP: gi/472586279/gb/EMS23807.1/ f-box protein pof6 [Rhodosporidium toruloides NP11] gi/647397635/emb/CDR40834.1/ RHTO0S05e07756g1_1 [Rhodosporidium toruloides] n=1 Tax=Rhodotorula toruloides TaxID=5286 RepID=A0A0K3CKG6_RHOTO|nr:Recyclin-1 [Rhodotorula toruloides]PRQ71410.1 Exocyst complex component Sec10-domain containing protein [Rhodotorula toruloides]
MERWTALMPDRAPALGTLPARPRLIGRLPEEAWVCVLQFLPVPDLPQVALCSRKLASIARDDRLWKMKLCCLGYHGPGEIDWRDGKEVMEGTRTVVADGRVAEAEARQGDVNGSKAADVVYESSDDEFGDFFEGDKEAKPRATGADDGFGDFQDGDLEAEDPFGLAEDFPTVALGDAPPRTKPPPADDLLLMFDDDVAPPTSVPAPPKPRRPPPVSKLTFETPIAAGSPTTPSSKPGAFTFNPSTPTSATPTSAGPSQTFLTLYKKHHAILLPYYISLQTLTTSSLVFTTSTLTPMLRAQLLASLARFCHPLVAPTRSLPQRMTVLRNVQSAIDFFESALLAEFERADSIQDEQAMKEKAEVMWELNQSTTVSQVFVQKRETLFGTNHYPLRNLTKIETPSGAEADGIDFSAMDRFMSNNISVLSREGSLIARVFPPDAKVLLYFLERIANDVVSDYIAQLLGAAQPLQNPLFLLATAATFGQVYRLVDAVLAIEPKNPLITKDAAEDVIFKMFEPQMDDYLSEEGEWIREVLEGMCEEWDRKTASALAVSDPTFLASSNPAQVKKNVLAGFTKVLLLPVTIIPKTASYGLNAITYGATGVIDTFASLGTQLSGNRTPTVAPAASSSASSIVEAPPPPPSVPIASLPIESSASAWGGDDEVAQAGRLSVDANGTISVANGNAHDIPLSSAPSSASTPPPRPATRSRFDRLQLLLSLDTALQLIQADRDSLKRIQTFIRYPGTYGRKVRDAIEEVFIVLLQVLGENHVCPAFEKAKMQMETYKPEDHDDDQDVAPLVQFFELVHIGDTIQQMVDVYFEKEMNAYIDKRDFLNVVVREKKKFETSLDDAVAQGLNAAVNILMGQVEHVITSRQGIRDYTPDESEDLDLQPTRACKDAIQVLSKHCDMLKGSTDKQILEVFNQEVGIRLHGILLKHLKRQIVSTLGGLQLIADLNAYHAFVTSLRQPQVTAYFTSLKMVGELFLIESPKDLGALVRDTTRYEGTLSPDDLYELVQRRADWSKIERIVDKQLFSLSAQDCCLQ